MPKSNQSAKKKKGKKKSLLQDANPSLLGINPGCNPLNYKALVAPCDLWCFIIHVFWQKRFSVRKLPGSCASTRTCWGLLVLWWWFGLHILITVPLEWLHDGSQFSKPQHHPSFAIPAKQTKACSDRCCLLQLRCSCGCTYLDNFCLSAKPPPKKHTNDHMH